MPPPPIITAPLPPDREQDIRAFLADSDNGCLFHDPAFLAYHPADRFRFHSLVARQGEKILAFIPGGLKETQKGLAFASPLGASVGGPVFASGMSLSNAQACVASLKTYARAQGWTGVTLTLPPAIYSRTSADLASFALFVQNFRLSRRWLCYGISIADSMATEEIPGIFHKSMRRDAGQAHRKGIQVSDYGPEKIDDFLALFTQTYTRLRTTPTHSPEEIRRLFALLPQSMRLILAYRDNRPVAGILLMLLNARIANSFYICSARGEESAGNVSPLPLLFAHSLQWLAQRKYRLLDLGPSASDRHVNEGVCFFKERLGATGHSRDQWEWTTGQA